MDKIVLDIETSNTFADVGGHRNIHDLNVSLIGAYSYKQDKYLAFNEHEINSFEPFLKSAGLIVGFAINRFDIPVLKKHFSFDLMALPRLDLLEEIETVLGRRVSLNALAKANLGLEKTHNGLEAITLYREGNFEELKNYCLNDVKLTKDLYELVKTQRYLLIPDRVTGVTTKISLTLKEENLLATLF
jgi:DEAD/DEAH box helicase domain-containing protein